MSPDRDNHSTGVAIEMSRDAAQLVFELVDAEIERLDHELRDDVTLITGRDGNLVRELLVDVRSALVEKLEGTIPDHAPESLDLKSVAEIDP